MPISVWRCDECHLIHRKADYIEVAVEEYSGHDAVTMGGGNTRLYWSVVKRVCRSCWEDTIERTRAEDPWDERDSLGASEEVVDAGREESGAVNQAAGDV